MTDTPRDEELDAIEHWCDGVLAQSDKKLFAANLCAFRRDLPYASIRSTILTLVAEVRRLRAAAGVSVLSQPEDAK